MERPFRVAAACTFLLSCLAAPGVTAADALRVDADAALVHATDPVSWLEDTAGRARLEEIRHRDAEFIAVDGATPNFGLSRSAFWLRYALESTGTTPQRLYLQLGNQEIADAALFVTVAGRLVRTEWTGARVPARVRPVADSTLVLPFELPARSHAVLYLRVTADGVPVIVPARVADDAALQVARNRELAQNGALAGVFGALFAGNLVLWALRRDRLYGLFVLLLLTAYAGLTARNGFGPAYLYPELTWPQRQGVLVALGLAAALMLQFTRGFLGTAQAPRLDRLLALALVAGGVMVAAAAMLPLSWSLPLDLSLFFLVPLLCAWAAWQMWRRGVRAARFHLAAQVLTGAALLHYALVLAGLLPWTAAGSNGFTTGVAAAALLLSLALADRHSLAQEAARSVDTEARRALGGRREELERMVEQRTAELEQARNHAEYLATTDPLTGIFNRRGLLPLLTREVELAQRAKQPLSLIAFDIDYFKRINDEFGQAEGDRILQEVVNSARLIVRSPDLFGRVAGEEFVLVLRDTAPTIARDVAERIRACIVERVRVGPDAHAVTASFGVASLGGMVDTADALQRAATAGIDRAKNRGRNRVVLIEHEHGAGAAHALLQPRR
jgi:two-component system, sensor histidine kinase LadS